MGSKTLSDRQIISYSQSFLPCSISISIKKTFVWEKSYKARFHKKVSISFAVVKRRRKQILERAISITADRQRLAQNERVVIVAGRVATGPEHRDIEHGVERASALVVPIVDRSAFRFSRAQHLGDDMLSQMIAYYRAINGGGIDGAVRYGTMLRGIVTIKGHDAARQNYRMIGQRHAK